MLLKKLWMKTKYFSAKVTVYYIASQNIIGAFWCNAYREDSYSLLALELYTHTFGVLFKCTKKRPNDG